MRTRRSALLSLLALLLSATAAAAQATTVSGTFHILWGDPFEATDPSQVRYLLVGERGEATDLLLDERDLRPEGGPLALNGRRVEVVAERMPLSRSGVGMPVLRVQSIRAAQPSAARTPFSRSMAAAPPQMGTKRYITILCKFADSPTVETPRATYEAWMGSVYGGLDHYWRETSREQINLTGTDVVGWHTLPRPRSDYITTGANGRPSANLNALFNDCTALADPVVNFPQYYGINLQFNQDLDGASWGGSRRASLDGVVNQTYGVTWMASWATMFVYAHETGHSLGLPHSSGPYDQVYDSRWDVMSGGSAQEASLGTRVPVHTIAWHKDALLGWVSAAQVYTAGVATKRTITIERSASPSSGDYVVAVIPIGNGQFYTVETRRFTGYDLKLPGEAVVIHRVNPFTGNSPARVVDADNNGNPNDAGAMWLPGETFHDQDNGITISVDGATGTGYQVTIHTGAVLGVKLSGMGRVASEPVGLQCSSGRATSATCSHGFGVGASVSLSAIPALGWGFTSWSGACAGSGRCTTVLSENRDVTASFAQLSFYISSDSLRPIASATVAHLDTLRTVGAAAGGASWTLNGGDLPPGLTLDPSGVLHGTPTTLGRYRFSATATAGARSDTRPFQVTVETPLRIVSDSVRPAVVAGVTFVDSLRATGSSGIFTWELKEGSLPPGVRIERDRGTLGGVPERAGEHTFTVQVTSSSGVTSTRRLTLAVTAPALEPARVLDQLLGMGTLRAEEIRYLDLLGNRNGRLDVGDVRAWLAENRQIDPARVPGLSEIVGKVEENREEPKENR